MADAFSDELFEVFEEKSTPLPVARPSETVDVEVKPSRSDAERAEDLLRKITSKRPAEGDTNEGIGKKAKTEDGGSSVEIMPRIQVHKVETVEACLHEVAVPPEQDFVPLVQSQSKPAKEYPFILDPFQKEAILCLENNQSVLVSAHTSAGKTVVAVYAIAMSLRDKQRVIYTSPIKALSNQKYRELYEEFQDVGLMTGDVTINPTASCLVMTTEILRSMLYRGSEIMREVAWVIFDEIHYMRDKERGVVWEETIILLPDNVHYVFLSATIPNATQFAEWVCHLHHQPCHVVYTDYRPIPLQHYIFPAGGDGLHLVVDENGDFREENFNTAMAVLREAGDAAKGDQRGRRGGVKGAHESSIFKIVKMIMERNFAPVIIFSFSRKECEAYGMQMSKLDFNTEEEKKLVEEVFNNAIDSLSDEDKKLPQVEHLLPLLKKGIGIHHSGLLPLLKETIEILFSEGLIKALFATETFAMGLNMPARTVLFTSCRKFDGKDFRWVTSGEYIQMSGRAGRRGLDERGIVILMVDDLMSPNVGKAIVKGSPDPLNSAFHLTYNMVLNLLRVEEINPEYMLERSFYQFQNYAAIPGLLEKLKKCEEKYNAMSVADEDQVSSYFRIRQQLDNLGKELRSFVLKPVYLLPFLQPGRLVKVKNKDDDFGWGVVVNFQKKLDQSGATEDSGPLYVVELLLNLSKDSSRSRNTSNIKPCPKGEKGEMQVVPITTKLIHFLSAIRVYIPNDLRSAEHRLSVLKSLQEVEKRFPDGIPLLDPIEDMGIKEKGLSEVVKKIEAFEHRLYTHPLHKDPRLEDLYSTYEKKTELGNRVKALRLELKKKKSLLQMDELKCRKRVLRRLGYCTASDVIETKGRVACEISSGDELVITELLFNNVFNDLSPAQCCALLSCFVFQERASEMPKLSEELSGPLRLMQDTAKRIARVSKEAKLEIEEAEYVESFRPHMMDVVYEWCNGCSFAKICKMTDIFEGSVIRCVRRLEETLRQMVQASKAIGNTELENKFAEGIRLIKRDIVFAASLYL
ncbi:exosome RNA helicase MTR4-like [Pomacea canaliculata]|uniref:exosome RNA helicase MTR4-like n=1 Tax=Pomacea canaliculata TaxID=400727 RepID=UPI000D73C887|nr:exosome RNA helicase MTR4-like [Pomacea canaliculata]XP_025110623.1 exosome RNA helicase MTR4-like [Pomacea canaliculata]